MYFLLVLITLLPLFSYSLDSLRVYMFLVILLPYSPSYYFIPLIHLVVCFTMLLPYLRLLPLLVGSLHACITLISW